MHIAKAFFFACLGILCLVGAYHFGAQSAGAQTSSQFRVVGSGESVCVVSGDDEYVLDGGVWHRITVLPVPASEIAAHAGYNYLTLDGIGWSYLNQTWVCAGPVPGAPTPAQSMSMGQLKARYATPASGK